MRSFSQERQISHSGKNLSFEVFKLVITGNTQLLEGCILLEIVPQELEEGILLALIRGIIGMNTREPTVFYKTERVKVKINRMAQFQVMQIVNMNNSVE